MTKRKTTEVLSISLPKELKKRVVKYAEMNDTTVSKFTRKALQNHLAEDILTSIQKELEPVFKELGIETDDDVEEYFG